jgi:cytochrome c oxidase cbb3-type subunit 3
VSRWMAVVCAISAGVVASGGCRRELRQYEDVAAGARRPAPPPVVSNQPGPGAPLATERDPRLTSRASTDPKNAWAVNDGARLYQWMNCTGCHANGGGGMGPALIDAMWIYGGEPNDLFRSIAGGRPNGMPAFGGRLTEEQIWHLVAYVRALSANVPADVRPSRMDAMAVKPPESLRSPEPPSPPAAGERR